VAVEITIDPKAKTAEQAAETMRDFVKRPPQDPVEAVVRFGELLNPSAQVGAAIADFFPAASFAVSLLSDLFGGFSAPSIGELTLKAISDLSAQLNKGLATLEKNLSKEIFEQSQRTIDVVLSGVDEVARQQSATIVFTELNARAIADSVRIESALLYENAQAELIKIRQESLQQLQADLERAREALNDQFQSALQKALSMVQQLAPVILAALEEVAAPPQAVQSRALPGVENDATGSAAPLLALGGIGVLLWLATRKKKN